MKYEIMEISPVKIAFIRHTGAYGASNYETMAKIKAFAKEQGIFDEKHDILGIAQDNPETTSAENCRYDACVTVDDNFLADIATGTAFGGRYAVFNVTHTAQGVAEAWSDIFTSNFEIDGARPIIERYRLALVNAGRCEICVPIK